MLGGVASAVRVAGSDRVAFGRRICVRRWVVVSLPEYNSDHEMTGPRNQHTRIHIAPPPGRTEADNVVVPRAAVHDVPRPRVVLYPPDEPLRAAFNLADTFLARDGTPGELACLRLPARVQHDHDFAQPEHQLVFDATYERLRARARAPKSLAHAAQREAELPRIARLGVQRRRSGSGERLAAREVRRERDGKCSIEDRRGKLEVAL